MKRTLLIAAIVLLAWKAEAADTIPTQFVGWWCQYVAIPVSADEKLTLYDRARKKRCEYDEYEMIVQQNSMFVAGEVICDLASITPPAAGKQQRLTFNCKRADGTTWSFNAYFSIQSKRLAVQTTKSGE